ncbi:MAG: accessory gene regulator B family protein [Oscillospiraceae bacterium]|nr:accessory gene regulator B family protein [Oscillospiraceae bacterium]
MIIRMSKSISSFFISHEVISDEDREVYEYSFEILLSTILSFLTILIIAIISDSMLNTIFFLVGFIPLRLIAGGYHAITHLRCYILFVLTYIAFLMITKFIPINLIVPLIFLSFPISITLIFLLAPSDDSNKTIDDKERNKFRKKSRWAIVGFSVLICTTILAKELFALSIALGNVTVAISLLANFIKNQGSKRIN